MIRIRWSRWVLGGAVALSALTLSPFVPSASAQNFGTGVDADAWKAIYANLSSPDPERKRAALILALRLTETQVVSEFVLGELAKAAANLVQPDLRGMAIQALATQPIAPEELSRIFRSALDTKNPLLTQSVALSLAGIHSRLGEPTGRRGSTKPRESEPEAGKSETVEQLTARTEANAAASAQYLKNVENRWKAHVPVTVELLGSDDPKILLPINDSLYRLTIPTAGELVTSEGYFAGLGELVPALVAELRSPDREVQRSAAKVLHAMTAKIESLNATGGRTGQIGFKKVLESQAKPLGEAIASLDYFARFDVLESLGDLRTAAAGQSDSLIAAMRDPSKFTRWAATRTLGKTIDAAKTDPVEPKVLDSLTLALSDREIGVRQAALDILRALGTRATSAAPEAATLLGYGDVEGQVSAVTAIAAMKNQSPGVVQALTKALSDPDLRLRLECARTLGTMGRAARGAIPLLKVLGTTDEDAGVRDAASRSLVDIFAAE